MVRRKTRIRDLVEELGMRNDEDEDVNRLDGVIPSKYNRKVHRDELLEACDRLDIETTDDDTVPNLREKIRDAGYTGRSDKKPETEFSTREVFRLIRALNQAKYLEAEDIGDIWDDVAKWAGELRVDGEWREVTDKSRGEPASEQPYDSYELYYFGQNARLAILHGLDTDECKYRHSVILEKRINDVPYRRWKKDEYVTSVELTQPSEEAGVDWGEADV